MARPILGWFGVVDERVDYGLLHDLARLRPQWSIAMVGPVVKIDPNLLPHSPNLFWLGSREYSVLPNYCRAFDVCIMPFALNAATEFINPTKALEYMATGRPIVSTPVKDVVRQWSDLVYVGRGAEQWAALVEKILAKGPDVQQRIDSGLERARAGSWDGTVRKMQGLIQEAIGRADRRSLKMPPPLTQVELEYLYQPTPGS
jgi:glycosyltransferase involved in cell wall biosynthesis